jgi:hypothetical protein
MLKNKNLAFVCLLILLAASEFGLVNSLSSLVHQYGETWKSILAATGYGGVAIAIIDKMLEILQ